MEILKSDFVLNRPLSITQNVLTKLVTVIVTSLGVKLLMQ